MFKIDFFCCSSNSARVSGSTVCWGCVLVFVWVVGRGKDYHEGDFMEGRGIREGGGDVLVSRR